MKRILTVLGVVAMMLLLAFTCEETSDDAYLLEEDSSFLHITVDTVMDTVRIYMNEDTMYVVED